MENISVELHGNGNIRLTSRTIAEPNTNEVLVETICSLISPGTERNLLMGVDGEDSIWTDLQDYPRLSGYSNIGRVLKVGGEVDPDLIGKFVHNHGAHQEYAISLAEKVTVIPDGVDWKDAVFSSLGKVAMNALRKGRLTWGESVLVLGMGILGQLAVRLALIAGAQRVVAVDTSNDRLSLLPDDERILKIQDAEGEFVNTVRQEGIEIDVAVEASGNPAVISNLAEIVRDQGRLIMLSSPTGRTSFHFHDHCNRKSLSIIGAHGFSHPPHGYNGDPWSSQNHAKLFMEYIRLGLLTPSALITHEFHGQNAASAYELLSTNNRRSLGILLNWKSRQ